ncbi:5,5'-dehydrodivanillate O-demethylase oxygenase subunit [Geodia barretti]|uniref:5,5'-dehydrodivanillate O-demethylase oxygenase subunit n=1 Tax=Geodia barretti TaxID=519541 RepID=A0AA35TQ07_GEOBA|nr:5,5'-dehydrodivanillate O-demethylase oxygenase subunit [Geodia barretti]
MGELMRRYWIPVRPTAQLVKEEVMAVRILGEDLVLFRLADGQMGLVGDRCPHRMTELRYGIPDTGGLRCCYHGWMFNPAGQCIETPLESANDPFKDRIRIKGYPVQEMGGLVWAYMGAGTDALAAAVGPCHENTGDPTHSVYLHGNLFEYVLQKQGKLEERAADGQMHTLYARMKTGNGIESLYVNPTRYGMEKGINYSKELGADRDHVSRHATVIFPFYTQTGGPGMVRQEFQIRVPVDDTNTYHINYGCYMGPEEVPVTVQESIPYYDVPLFDDDGKPLLDFVLAQDAHAWISQGPIMDRTQEHLGRTDMPIVFMRRQFEEQMRIVEDGGDPMNVFRDPATMPSLIHGGHWDEREEEGKAAVTGKGSDLSSFRGAYHKGYAIDDADRYGPAMPQVIDLMRRIDEAQEEAARA